MFCRDPLGEEPVATCETCRTALHADCAAELRRCPTIGCAGSWPSPSGPGPSDREPAAAALAPAVCVFCRDVLAGTSLATCEACRTALHADCAAELRRCPTIGCAGPWPPAPGDRRPPAATAPLALGREPDGASAARRADDGQAARGSAGAPARRARRAPRRAIRAALALALAPVALTWVAHARPRPGVERVLGGWFTGHGSGLNAALGTWTRHGYRNRRNVGVVGVAFSSDGERIATLGEDGEVRLWSTSTGDELTRPRAPGGDLDGGHGLPGLDLLLQPAPDGVDLVVASGYRLEVLRGALAGAGATGLDWGAALPTEGAGEAARARSVRASRRAVEREPGGPPVTLRLARQVGAAMQVLEVGPGPGPPRRLLRVPLATDTFVSAALSPDGRVLAVADAAVTLSDLEAGGRRELPVGRVGGLAWSPDGRLLAGRTLTQVLVWALGPGPVAAPRQLPVPGAWAGVDRLAFDARGELLVGVGSRRVFVWDLATERLLADLPGHGTSVHALAASPCGRWFATGSKDQTARLWRLPGR